MIGVNGRLDTLQAAVLLAKLEVFDEEIARRVQVAGRYGARLAGVARTPWIEPRGTSVYAQYTIEVDNRDAVQKRLKAAGVPTAVHYPVPLNLQPAFAGLGLGEGSFPRAEAAARRVMSLPMHAYMDAGQHDFIIEAVRTALARETA
jgi:UDP-2-acetamido-2-deoxy-ribo-hexuluronate aminotransferase